MPASIISPSNGTSLQNQTLQRLFQARNEWDRLHQLSNLLKESHIDVPIFFESPQVWQTLCRETDPEMLAWRLAREIQRHADGRVPRCLQPYLTRRDLEQKDRQTQQQQLKTALQHWLEAEPTSDGTRPSRSTLRPVWTVASGNDPLRAKLQIELIQEGAKGPSKPKSFSQIKALCLESQRQPMEFSAADAALLRWLTLHLDFLLQAESNAATPFQCNNRTLILWLQQWGTNGRLQDREGNPVTLAEGGARIVPRLEELTGARRQISLDFEVRLPDGTARPLADAHFFLRSDEETIALEPELVHCQGVFYRLEERPPVAILSLLRQQGAGRLPLSALQALLPPLLKRYPEVAATIRQHLRTVPVGIKYYFQLDEDDHLRVSLQAHGTDGGVVWDFSPSGWRRRSGRPAASASTEANGESIWHELPEVEITQSAQDWLDRWGIHPIYEVADWEEGAWYVDVTPAGLNALAEVWKDRNPAWEYFGNKRFQNLFLNRRRIAPKITVHSNGLDWFEIKAEWAEEGLKLTAEDWLRFAQEEGAFIKLSSGSWIRREEMEAVRQTESALASLGVEMGQEAQKMSVWQAACAPAAIWEQLSSVLEAESIERLKPLQEAVQNFQGIPEIEVPVGVTAQLRPYQRTGLNFLVHASNLKLGAVLADDMGLGKTLQSLCWLEHLKNHHGSKPSLVVCPASVVFNWKQEATQFTPSQRVLILEAGQARHALRPKIAEHDLIITNYALLRRDLVALRQFEFRAVILDEAQNIKNPDSYVTKAAKLLRAEHRLALTGTPLENRLLDLWSIVDFVQPGYLGRRSHFVDKFDKSPSPASSSLLASRLRPMLLRRRKQEVAKDLPDRIEERIDCELTVEQRKFYLAELQRCRRLVSEVETEGPAMQRVHILAALTRLRQICCHPSLASGKEGLASGKTDALLELLEPLLQGGHKVLVFSQFVGMLNILEKELNDRKIPYWMLTGQTRRRGDVVKSFQEDPRACVFLLSLKAAGTGLNLTSASYVVLYDPWWNPAVEAQAIDRTHRIGQDRTVFAYRLVTKSTVEEKIWELQQRKQQLAVDVLGEEGFGGSLTKEDLQFLLEDAEPAE